MGTLTMRDMDPRTIFGQSNVHGTHYGRGEGSEAEMAFGRRLNQ
jgi:hypothetical protein